jgi:hypothetical protein
MGTIALAPPKESRTTGIRRRRNETSRSAPSVIWPTTEAVLTTAALINTDPISDQFADEDISLFRETTARELLIGELRSWRLFGPNWDGEGASAPDIGSLKSAEHFARLVSESNLPAPTLYASGRAGLFWNSPSLYADIEFLNGNRISYYIERAGDKHKGVVNYSADQMPPVLAALLQP